MTKTYASAHQWLLLAVCALSASGLFAFIIAGARLPWIAPHLSAIDFFKRALVVHVDLAILVWFVSLPVALFCLIGGQHTQESAWRRSLVLLAMGGTLLFSVFGFSLNGEPYLSNYIPMNSHPLFIAGILCFLAGVGLTYASGAVWARPAVTDLNVASPFREALSTVQFGVRIGALYYLVAMIVLVFAFSLMPPELGGLSRYEVAMWGGGHVLQFAHIAFMLVAWVAILSSWMGTAVLSRRQVFVLFAALGAPMFVVPWIAAHEVTSGAYRNGFTQLMRWGLFPAISLALVMLLPKVYRTARDRGIGDVRPLAFLFSIALLISGIVFGALVRGPDLRLPGHYHAAIGAVTVSFMALAYVLLREFGHLAETAFTSPFSRANAICYGIGQLGFSGGMFIAGVYGMARKTYGVDQTIHHAGQTVGLYVMGAGGGLALVGGLIFSVLMLKAIGLRYRGLVMTPTAPRAG